mgnify:CR=1 FL=1
MENEYIKGYPIKEYKQPVKRYCQTLDLKNEPTVKCIAKGKYGQKYPLVYEK